MLCFSTVSWVLNQKWLLSAELAERSWYFTQGEIEAHDCLDFLMANPIMAGLGLSLSEFCPSMAKLGTNSWFRRSSWVLWACYALCPPNCLQCNNVRLPSCQSQLKFHIWEHAITSNSSTSGKGVVHLFSPWTHHFSAAWGCSPWPPVTEALQLVNSDVFKEWELPLGDC